jgi:hypothetical protein
MAEEYCPVCKYKNEVGVLECILCGTPLENGNGSSSKHATTNVVAAEAAAFPQPVPPILQKSLPVPTQGIAIYALESDTPIAVQEAGEFILGRKMTDELDGPIVDLQQAGGYDHGVSRHHSLIRATDDGYEIVDLGSTNGTWLEKQRLVPGRRYPLESGARIHLGRLALLVIYQKPVVKK